MSLRRRTHRRLIALLAAIALIAVSGLYSAHDHGHGGHEKPHCDLCVHFSGTAGSPAHLVLPGKPVLAVRVPPAGTETILPSRRKVGIHLPRGPPGSALI